MILLNLFADKVLVYRVYSGLLICEGPNIRSSKWVWEWSPLPCMVRLSSRKTCETETSVGTYKSGI